MKLTLQEWDRQEFSKPHSLRTLRAWAASGTIQPKPTKVGREYMVDSFAQYVPLRPNSTSIDDPVVNRILNDVAAA